MIEIDLDPFSVKNSKKNVKRQKKEKIDKEVQLLK